MSNSVMTTVWKQSKQEGTHRLLHVALADGVNDHGFGYHGVEFLAEKCAVSDRQTQRLRDDLERDGEIYVRRGSGRGIKTQYLVCTGLDGDEIQWRLEKYFDMEFAEAKNVTLSVLEKRVTFLSKRVTSRDKKGDKKRVKGDISNSENEGVYSHGDKSNPVAPATTTINHNTEPYNLSLQKVADATSANANILGQEIDNTPDTEAQVKAKQDKAVAKLSEPTPDEVTHFLQEKASENTPSKVPPKVSPPPARAAKVKAPPKPSIVQPVNDAIAQHIQGIPPAMATGLTGTLSQKAAGVWRRHLTKDKLTAEDYGAVARSIQPFTVWFGKECEGCALPTKPDTFESRYAQFVSATLGNGKQAQQVNDYIRIPHPDPAKAALGIFKTVHRTSQEAKSAIANGTD